MDESQFHAWVEGHAEIRDTTIAGGPAALEYDFRDKEITNCLLLQLSFHAGEFRGTQFTNTTLIGVAFEHCTLRNVTFKTCLIHDCKFDACDLVNVVFEDHVLEDCSLRGVSFSGSTLKNVRFRNCDLTGVDLRSARAVDLVIGEGCEVDGLHLARFQLGKFIHLQDTSQATRKKLDLDKTLRPSIADRIWLARRTLALIRYKLNLPELLDSALSVLGMSGAFSIAIWAVLTWIGFEPTWLQVRIFFLAALVVVGLPLFTAYVYRVEVRRRSLRQARVLGVRESPHPC